MATLAKSKTVTFEEFCFLVKDGEKADLIDGVIYMASPDNTDANELQGWLATILSLFLDEVDLGKLYTSRVAFRLAKRNSPEPDIAFVKKQRLHLVKRGHVEGPPDAAIEIVSPDSIQRDYLKKRRQYQRFKVPEYWIIDEVRQRVVMLRLGEDGKYHQVKPKNGELHSEVLPGFWFRPEWFWQQPLPKKTKILQEILGRKKGKRADANGAR